ncbi:hypothetical protein L1049_009670 [Liquidambar formosana]|uniref:Uncharacterized protein n=1 Tax=Liquidambar formosana TaxID=63359 RepID=A0AAP0N733_LIQFO
MTKFQPYSYSHEKILTIFSILIFIQPILVSSKCTCEAQYIDENKAEALKYKLVAIASILAASAIGVCLPFLVKNISALHPEKSIYFLIKSFAAGVILATGFIHVLPDAFASLTSPCLSDKPWGNFPFMGFVTMMSTILTLIIESFATGYHRRSELRKAQPVQEEEGEESGEANAAAHHVHGPAFILERQLDSSDLIRHRIISQVLELGIVVHSVIIGISVGASESPKTIKPLVAALSFHQFFEGMGLGGCISQAKYKRRAITIMALFFSLTTPTGIAVGIGISNIYDEKSPTALIVQGILNSASAGILIYMALVDLLAADFMNPKMQTNVKLQLGANATLLLGACCMSLLAKWECTCESSTEDYSKGDATKYKVSGICSILTASALGVSLPILGKKFQALQPESDIFFLVKAFAAGVILATGFIHVLPDAFESLTSPCLGQNPWGNFPFTGFVAMVSAIGTLMIDAFANSYYKRSHFNKALPVVGVEDMQGEHEGHLHVHTHAMHGHAHGSSFVLEDSASSDLLRNRVVSQVLELGIVVHSVIIGISLGASESPETIKPLVAALTFHQFFEGMGLGGCISQDY